MRHPAIWLIVLVALAVSETPSRTQQISPAIPEQAAPSDEVTLRVIVVDSAEEAQSIVKDALTETPIPLEQPESFPRRSTPVTNRL